MSLVPSVERDEAAVECLLIVREAFHCFGDAFGAMAVMSFHQPPGEFGGRELFDGNGQ